MTGVYYTAIGHLDGDGLAGYAGVGMGTVGFEIMSRGASIGDPIIIDRGWDTA